MFIPQCTISDGIIRLKVHSRNVNSTQRSEFFKVYDFLKNKMTMKRGRPSNPSGEQPSRAFYKCPVDTCTYGKIRGDDISRHFQRFANLDIVDNATEHFSNLRTQKSKEASDTIELSDEYLNFLLTNVSNLERLHSKYLFQNRHTSSNLPNCDSKNFKCQQKRNQYHHWFRLGQKGLSLMRHLSLCPLLAQAFHPFHC